MTDSIKNHTFPKEIEVQLQMQAYLDRALGYYIFARKAVLLGVVPVGGNLFHNAMEMVLHCGLSNKYAQGDLKSRFGNHELSNMWVEFKTIFTDTNLVKLDKFVNHHRQWKDLRYPKSNAGSLAIFFGPKKPDPEVTRKNKDSLKGRIIDLNLEEMDQFMATIIRTIGISPDYIKLQLQRRKELMEFYLSENSDPLFSIDTMVISPTSLLQR